jgi:hypothetical protein
VEASTGSAWCLAQAHLPAERRAEDEVWVPRSCAELYRRAEDGLETPDEDQVRLHDFGQ